MSELKVAVIGAGFIGRGWIIAFARAGMSVAVWSRNRATSESALDYVRQIVPELAAQGLLGGRNPDDVLAAIKIVDSLEGAVEGAHYIQENLTEDVDLKRDILSRLDAIAAPDAIIASSTSALVPTRIMTHLAGRDRCIVAHPLNPPHLIPATEVVPHPWTTQEVIDRTCTILEAAGQKPVLLRKEIDGFVVNRLQAALLNEAFRLVSGGFASIDDVDTAIKDGLALRWSFMGPFETIDLNATHGVRDYVERNDGLFTNLLSQMRDPVDWKRPLDEIERDRRAALPSDQLRSRQIWRDRRLAALAAHKLEAASTIGK
jgi:L-gulonate 3-dehydrogenase